MTCLIEHFIKVFQEEKINKYNKISHIYLYYNLHRIFMNEVQAMQCYPVDDNGNILCLGIPVISSPHHLIDVALVPIEVE